MLDACAGRQLHGVGAQRDVAPVAAILDDAPQSLGLTQNARTDQAQNLQAASLPDESGLVPAIAQEEETVADRRYPPMPDMGRNRDEALNQIRTKAAGSGKIKPDVFEEAHGSTKQLSAAEQQRLSGRIDSEIGLIDERISAEEIAKKQAEAEWLKKRGRTHYQETLNDIEK